MGYDATLPVALRYVFDFCTKYGNKNMVLFSALLLGPSVALESTSCQGPDVTYIGTVSKTKSGKTCQNWNETDPQKHTYTDVGEHNYCRNPTKTDVGVWCYTTTKWIRWEKCQVPLCEEPEPQPEPPGGELRHPSTNFFLKFGLYLSLWFNVPFYY